MHADILDLSKLWLQGRAGWLQWVRTHKGISKAYMARNNTRDAYRSGVGLFLRGHSDLLRVGFRPPRPWAATSVDARAFKDALTVAGKAPATINQRLAGCKSFYNFVINNYRIPRVSYLDSLLAAGLLWVDDEDPTRLALFNPSHNNPFNSGRIERLHVKAYGRASFPGRSEMDALLSQIELTTLNGLRDYALFYLMLTSTRRISEVRLMKWGDIEEQDDGQKVWNYIGKGREPGRAIIGPSAWLALKTYLEAGGRWGQLRPPHYIFVGHEGNAQGEYRYNPTSPISYSAVASSLKKYGELAGVDPGKTHCHALRHRGLHNRLEEQEKTGAPDLLALRDIAGHKSAGTTEIYIHSSDRRF